jgi:hypothetical protein
MQSDLTQQLFTVSKRLGLTVMTVLKLIDTDLINEECHLSSVIMMWEQHHTQEVEVIHDARG